MHSPTSLRRDEKSSPPLRAPCSVPAQESVPNALRQFGIDFENGFNADDIDAVMEHFADDGVFVTHDGQRIEGKEAIRAEFAPMLDASSPAVRFHVLCWLLLRNCSSSEHFHRCLPMANPWR